MLKILQSSLDGGDHNGGDRQLLGELEVRQRADTQDGEDDSSRRAERVVHRHRHKLTPVTSATS